MICLLLRTGLYTSFTRDGAPLLQLNQCSQRPELAFLETCTHCCWSLKSISNLMVYLLHATKNKELQYKVDKHSRDCTSELNNDSVSSLTKINREPVKTKQRRVLPIWKTCERYLWDTRAFQQSLEKVAFSNLSKEERKHRGSHHIEPMKCSVTHWNYLQIFSSLLHRDCTESLNIDLKLRNNLLVLCT